MVRQCVNKLCAIGRCDACDKLLIRRRAVDGVLLERRAIDRDEMQRCTSIADEQRLAVTQQGDRFDRCKFFLVVGAELK